jgi:hypothetical protein
VVFGSTANQCTVALELNTCGKHKASFAVVAAKLSSAGSN